MTVTDTGPADGLVGMRISSVAGGRTDDEAYDDDDEDEEDNE
jgi:hypothetical protein